MFFCIDLVTFISSLVYIWLSTKREVDIARYCLSPFLRTWPLRHSSAITLEEQL